MGNEKKENTDIVFEESAIVSRIFNQKNILKTISIVSIFIIWGLLVHFRVYRFSLLPSPSEVLEWGQEWVTTSTFWIDALATFLRVYVAVIAACLIGIPLGLMIGWKKAFSDLTLPFL